ncbi:MAG: hypothetical protein ACR2H3_06235, partial [Acidimicrobiales bacterium]
MRRAAAGQALRAIRIGRRCDAAWPKVFAERTQQLPHEDRGDRDRRPHGDLLVDAEQRCGYGSEVQR